VLIFSLFLRGWGGGGVHRCKLQRKEYSYRKSKNHDMSPQSYVQHDNTARAAVNNCTVAMFLGSNKSYYRC
jgi:hypothetical protein